MRRLVVVMLRAAWLVVATVTSANRTVRAGWWVLFLAGLLLVHAGLTREPLYGLVDPGPRAGRVAERPPVDPAEPITVAP